MPFIAFPPPPPLCTLLIMQYFHLRVFAVSLQRYLTLTALGMPSHCCHQRFISLSSIVCWFACVSHWGRCVWSSMIVCVRKGLLLEPSHCFKFPFHLVFLLMSGAGLLQCKLYLPHFFPSSMESSCIGLLVVVCECISQVFGVFFLTCICNACLNKNKIH